MKKRSVTKLLIGSHIVILGAIFFRVDTFPLTWVPMYSLFKGGDTLSVPVGDKAKLKKGFEVTTLSGATEYVGPRELNIPKAAFRRIYTQRAYGKGPPKHLKERHNLNPISDAVFNQFYPDPATSIDWHERILDMLNATLDREPGDPNYIVKAVATYEFTNFDRADLRIGDTSKMNSEMRTSVIKRKTP